MLSISAFPWRRSTEILYDRLLLRYFQLCWNQGLPEMSWDSLFKWDFLLSFFLSFFKEKAKVKINDFLDGIYLSWTHLDICEVEPVYESHKVPRKFWLNPEWPKNSLAWILTCYSLLKIWTLQINLLFSINILFIDWCLPVAVNYSEGEYYHVFLGTQRDSVSM